MKHQPKKCPECGGGLKRQAIIHTQPWGEKLYRFENVSAFVCAQCGHALLEAAVSQQIDKIIHEHRRPARYERVPVFSVETPAKS